MTLTLGTCWKTRCQQTADNHEYTCCTSQNKAYKSKNNEVKDLTTVTTTHTHMHRHVHQTVWMLGQRDDTLTNEHTLWKQQVELTVLKITW